jgi:hypothetical protein
MIVLECSPAKAGAQGSGNRCFAAAWTPAFAGERSAP